MYIHTYSIFQYTHTYILESWSRLNYLSSHVVTLSLGVQSLEENGSSKTKLKISDIRK